MKRFVVFEGAALVPAPLFKVEPGAVLRTMHGTWCLLTRPDMIHNSVQKILQMGSTHEPNTGQAGH